MADGRALTGAAPCPICQAPAAPRIDNPAFPFCSDRCRLIDLGTWLDGEYRLPVLGDGPSSEPEE